MPTSGSGAGFGGDGVGLGRRRTIAQEVGGHDTPQLVGGDGGHFGQQRRRPEDGLSPMMQPGITLDSPPMVAPLPMTMGRKRRTGRIEPLFGEPPQEAASLAQEVHQQLVPTGTAADAGEAPRQHTARDDAIELALDDVRKDIPATRGGMPGVTTRC